MHIDVFDVKGVTLKDAQVLSSGTVSRILVINTGDGQREIKVVLYGYDGDPAKGIKADD